MNTEDIRVETIDDLIGRVRTTGTRLIIPLNRAIKEIEDVVD